MPSHESREVPPTHAGSPSFFDWVDAVLVINLDQRTDRWERFCNAAKDLIPQDKIIRISAVYGKDLPGYGQKPWFHGRKRDATWAARAGCTLSHKKALEVAAGFPRCLILEDDIEWISGFPSISRHLPEKLISLTPQWGVCYLGYTDPMGPFRYRQSVDGDIHVCQVYGCNCAHAYLVTRESASQIAKSLPDEHNVWHWLSHFRSCDKFFIRDFGRRFDVLCISPSLINQFADFSDITQRSTTHLAESTHITAIPAEKITNRSYKFRYLLQICRCRILQTWDHIRALAKRINGF